jgi:hypothetical protein
MRAAHTPSPAFAYRETKSPTACCAGLGALLCECGPAGRGDKHRKATPPMQAPQHVSSPCILWPRTGLFPPGAAMACTWHLCWASPSAGQPAQECARGSLDDWSLSPSLGGKPTGKPLGMRCTHSCRARTWSPLNPAPCSVARRPARAPAGTPPGAAAFPAPAALRCAIPADTSPARCSRAKRSSLSAPPRRPTATRRAAMATICAQTTTGRAAGLQQRAPARRALKARRHPWPWQLLQAGGPAATPAAAAPAAQRPRPAWHLERRIGSAPAPAAATSARRPPTWDSPASARRSWPPWRTAQLPRPRLLPPSRSPTSTSEQSGERLHVGWRRAAAPCQPPPPRAQGAAPSRGRRFVVPKDKASEFQATWREREAVMRQHRGFQGLSIVEVQDMVTVSSRCAGGWGWGWGLGAGGWGLRLQLLR